MKSVILAALLLLPFAVGVAQARTDAPRIPSIQMTCAQAISVYENYKRIYVLTLSGDIVPVYGPKPVSQRRKMFCKGHNQHVWSYWVRTRDDNTCVIGAYCQ